ncbi:cell wall integrity and stress response component 4 [Drosophila navojoa]|uniref:cell wall integrity and stress response component 4 n=1 Tax=Drosophila navojoa TaxID=7232 RepID=UPI0011BFD5B2|nr:cell wall integrity and stress response component 4 [Drosophila navojoa]
MRAHYVLACLAVLVATTAAANIRPTVNVVNNSLYRRYVCVNKSNGFRALVPGSCSRFYECQNGVASETSCPGFYDPKVQGCVNYNTGCVEVMQVAGPVVGNNVEPCGETIPTTTPCAEVTTPPCEPETTPPCNSETTPTTTTCTTTTCTTPTTTTCATTKTTTTKTTTCTTPTTTTCTTTTCTTPTTTTCTTTKTTTTKTTTTTTCTTPTTTTCTTTTTTTTKTTTTTTTCAPITTPTTCTTTTCSGQVTTTACAPGSSGGKVRPSSVYARPAARPLHSALPAVMDQHLMPLGGPSNELSMNLYTTYVCRNKPDGFMLASLTSCNNYYICRYGKPLQVSCGAKYFNALKGICDLPENTRCIQPRA